MQVHEKVCAMDVPMVGVRYVRVSVVFFFHQLLFSPRRNEERDRREKRVDIINYHHQSIN